MPRHDTSLLGKDAYFFAPGAIEGGAVTRAERGRLGVRWLRRLVVRLVVAALVLTLGGVAVGYLGVALGAGA